MKSIKEIILTLFFVIALLSLMAQTTEPPDPNGGNDPTTNGNIPVGGNAPVGGGLLILLALGVSYGGTRTYKLYKK